MLKLRRLYHRSTALEEIDKLFEGCQARLKHLVELESQGPFTLNDHYYSATLEKTMAIFKAARSPKQAGVVDKIRREQAEREVISNLSTLGYQGVRVEDFPKIIPDDEFKTELDAAAHTIANFKVSPTSAIALSRLDDLTSLPL